VFLCTPFAIFRPAGRRAFSLSGGSPAKYPDFVASSLRFLLVVAIFCSCSVSFAVFFGPGPWSVGCVWPINVVSGTYQHRDANRTIALQVGLDRFANLRVFEQNAGHKNVSASGVVLITALMPEHFSSKDWPPDGFVFKGVSDVDGSVLIREYRATWRQIEDSGQDPHYNSANEITDITDPANPITLSRQKEPAAPIPWTTTFVISALIVGGLLGRYSAKRGDKTHDSASPQ
jgi:hypothetical protein